MEWEKNLKRGVWVASTAHGVYFVPPQEIVGDLEGYDWELTMGTARVLRVDSRHPAGLKIFVEVIDEDGHAHPADSLKGEDFPASLEECRRRCERHAGADRCGGKG